MNENIPAGFTLVTHHAEYGRHNGPFWQKDEPDGSFVRAFRVLDRHLNRAKIVHGGMLATFVDMVLAQAVLKACRQPGFTVRLVTDYIGPAKQGDWLEGRARLLRRTQTLAFADAVLSVGGRRVVKASGVFRINTRVAPVAAE